MDYLLRGLSPDLNNWIEESSYQKRITKKEFLLSVLENANSNRLREDTPSLFDYARRNSFNNTSLLPFTFIDLFAGIGGLRIGLERAGGRCVFSSEWDKYSQKTYSAWFGEIPHGDITKIALATIPDHDVLAAGFPCQPFSIAGVSKKNSLGRCHGFEDKTQGTLFFHVATIIQIKRPPVVLLENVKNLVSHDKGRTWEIIKSTLLDLGYAVFSAIIDAANYVPQHRERIFIVCFDQKVFGTAPPFEFPSNNESIRPKFSDILEKFPDSKYTLTDHLWKYLQDYAKRHKEKGNGFGFGMTDMSGHARTLSARYYKDGSEVLIPQKGKNPRRLTPREAARLMGFPDELPIVVSDTQAYKQFGNAVVPLVSEAVAKQIVKTISWQIVRNGSLLKRKTFKAA